MDHQGGNWSVRRSNLAVRCSVCGTATPFDPTVAYPTCSSCQAQRMAWSHSANDYQMPQSMNYAYLPPQGSPGYGAPQKMNTGYPASMSYETPQGMTTCYGRPISYQAAQGMDTSYARSMNYKVPQGVSNGCTGSIEPRWSLKRKAVKPPDEDGYPNGYTSKRVFTNTPAYHSSPLKHFTVGGRLSQAREASPEEDDDEVFVDAPEEQQQYHDGVAGRMEHRSVFKSAQFVDDEMEEEEDGETNADDQGSGLMSLDSSAQEGEEEEEVADLFSRTFSDEVKENSEEDDNGTTGSPVVEIDKSESKPAAARSKKAKRIRTTAPNHTSLQGSTAPDPVNNLSPNYTYLRDFHNRAKPLIPHLPLADHRYWIGVLNVGGNPKGFSKEKHFTWMKGNRLTTVSTVWHTYQNTTATDDFVLLLGMEKVAFTDRMEELDYFSEKKIMFRAVEQGHEDAGGREACYGVIPAAERLVEREVIEID